MPRWNRLVVAATLTTALLGGTVPAAAAPANGWGLLEDFSPLAWIRSFWAGETVPWLRAGDGDDPPSAPKALWAENGIGIDPWGQPLAVAQPGEPGTAPSGQQP